MSCPSAVAVCCRAQAPVRQRRVRAGRGASLRRPALRAGSPVVRGLVARRKTRCTHFVRYAQTVSTSLIVDARCARGHEPFAPRRRRGAPQPAQTRLCGRRWCSSPRKTTAASARQAVPGGGDFWGDEKRRPGVGARSAHQQLTRRICLSAVSAANEASYATRPQADAVRPDTEQSTSDCSVPGARPGACKRQGRSGVDAKRRPPQHEPPPGTACRAAQIHRESDRSRTPATGRSPPIELRQRTQYH